MSLTINHQTNDISATSGSVTIGGSAVGGGGHYSLVSHTTTSSTASQVLFENLNDDYITYQLVLNWVHASQVSTGANCRFYDGSTLLNNYGIHNNDTANQSSSTGQTSFYLTRELSGIYFHSVMEIWGIGLTNKALHWTGTSFTSTSGNQTTRFAGWRAGTSGVTPDKIEIRALWSNIPAGANLTLYGRKSS
jgi:hypothetical protein